VQHMISGQGKFTEGEKVTIVPARGAVPPAELPPALAEAEADENGVVAFEIDRPVRSANVMTPIWATSVESGERVDGSLPCVYDHEDAAVNRAVDKAAGIVGVA
jgi:hypothetical protein